MLIQLLNPSAAPVTVKKNEKVGILKPLIKLSENVCVVGQQPKPVDRKARVDKAIEQLLSAGRC